MRVGLASLPKLPLLRGRLGHNTSTLEMEWAALEWKSTVILLACAAVSGDKVSGIAEFDRNTFTLRKGGEFYPEEGRRA